MSVARQFVIAALVLLGANASLLAEKAPQSPTPAAVIRLSGEIDDFSRDNLFRRFREAQAAGAKTIIIEFNTPGGLVTSGMDISRFLRGQSTVHTIAYINTAAYSAGTLDAMACDEIVMAPSAVIGDCAPIMLNPAGNGLAPLPPTERAKIQSPLLQDFHESCIRNGYNPLLADAMVKVDSSVYLISDAAGKERIVNEADYKKLTAGGDFKPAAGVSNPINTPDTLLTVSPAVAKRLGLSKGTATSYQDLANQRNLTIVADLTPTFGDTLIEFLNGNGARFMLIVVFLLSLYIAMHAPGHGAAEAIAIVSLGLLVCIPMLTGFAQWWELALILVGLGLCAFELLVFPGHGASLITGLIMILCGLLLTFAGRDVGPGWLPSSHDAMHRLKNGAAVISGAIVVAAICGAIMRPFLPKLPLFRKLILTETSGGQLAAAGAPLKAGEDVWPFVGTVGITTTDLRPGGIVQFPYGADTRSAPVVSASGYIDSGSKVIVQDARGNRIVVKKS
ncbi:MAG TPA: hypothetical protein VFE47_24800 [Tepidisphaeraceae bacterium]|jgi:membrane-bound serine protease (ClpP class)|nr:hypothetical protein [Tepidisphaeraceae bacterium]